MELGNVTSGLIREGLFCLLLAAAASCGTRTVQSLQRLASSNGPHF